MAGPASEGLLQRIAAGDDSAVEACLDRYGALVWSLARRFSAGAADAEDAVQEVFISLWRSAHRYDPAKASETTFVATIARRRLIDRLRARGVRPEGVPLLESDATARTGTAAQIEATLDVDRARAVFGTLAEPQRRVLQLAVLGGLTHTEIAEQTGLALGTVKTHVRRGLIRVRAALAAGDGDG